LIGFFIHELYEFDLILMMVPNNNNDVTYMRYIIFIKKLIIRIISLENILHSIFNNVALNGA